MTNIMKTNIYMYALERAMWNVNEGNMETFDSLDSSERTFAIFGDK